MASRSSVRVRPFSRARPKVVRELVGVPANDQGGDGDEAAVPGGELGPVPDVVEEHVVGQRGQFRGDVADCAAAATDLSGLIGHRCSFRLVLLTGGWCCIPRR